MTGEIAKRNTLLIRPIAGAYPPAGLGRSFRSGTIARRLPPVRKCQAFTLIELLVVISIIALLMAILLPTLRRVRNQARAVVCQTNLKQWGMTVALYTEDNEGRLPFYSSFRSDMIWLLRGSFVSSDDPHTPESLHRVDTKGIGCCPMAVRRGSRVHFFGSRSDGLVMEGWHGSTFEAWEITIPSPPFRTSYGLNAWLFTHRFDTSVPVRTRLRLMTGTNIFPLRGRADIPVILDSTRPYGEPDDHDQAPIWETAGPHMGRFCINRHNGHVNGLFLDWSVRKIGLKELWTLKWHLQFDTANEWTRAGGVCPEDWPRWMRKFKDY